MRRPTHALALALTLAAAACAKQGPGAADPDSPRAAQGSQTPDGPSPTPDAPRSADADPDPAPDDEDPCEGAREGEACTHPYKHCPLSCDDACSPCSLLICEEGVWNMMEEFPEPGCGE